MCLLASAPAPPSLCSMLGLLPSLHCCAPCLGSSPACTAVLQAGYGQGQKDHKGEMLCACRRLPEPVFLKDMTYFVQAANGCKLFLVKVHGLQEADTMHREMSLIRHIRAWRGWEMEVSKALGFPVLEYKATILCTRSLRNRSGLCNLSRLSGKASGSGDMKIKSYPCGWSTPTKTIASQMTENLQLFSQT